MIRNVKEDIYQIGTCVAEETGAEAVHIYVIMNDGHPILIDCGSHLQRANLMAELDTVLDGATPDWIFLTHTELPHSGNLQQVAEKWPNIQVKVSNVLLSYIEIAPVIPLEQITMATPGSEWVIGRRRLISVDALLKDQPGSQWIYDPATKTMFTGDGFGYYHPVEQCGKFSDEIEGGIRIDQFQRYHHDAFRFLRWVMAEKFNVDLDRVFGDYPVETIAPTHGSAIRSEIPAHLERFKAAVTNICATNDGAS